MSTLTGYISKNNFQQEYVLSKKILKFQEYFQQYEYDHICATYPSIKPTIYEDKDFLFIAIGNLFKNNFTSFLKKWPRQKEKAFLLLDGNFLLYIKDKNNGDIWLVNDVFATYPCYYHYNSDGLFFSSFLLALKPYLKNKYLLNEYGLAELLYFAYNINQNTIYQDVKILGYGSYLFYQKSNNSLKTSRYYSYERSINNSRSLKDTIAQAADIFEQETILRRNMNSTEEHSFLSGGLDTRNIIAALQKHNIKVDTYTHNDGDENDIYCAKKISKKLLGKAHFFYCQPDFIEKWGEKTIFTSDGVAFNLVASSYGLLDQYKEQIKEMYDGHIGDPLFGTHMAPEQYNDVNDHDFKIWLLQRHRVLPEELILPEKRKSYKTYIDSQLDLFLKAHQCPDQLYKSELYSYLQRQVRYLTAGIQRRRSMVDVKMPYASKTLFEFMFTVPRKYRNEDRIVQKGITKTLSPELARCPMAETRYLGVVMSKPMQIIEEFLYRLNNLRWKIKPFAGKEICPNDKAIKVVKKKMISDIYQQQDVLENFIDFDYLPQFFKLSTPFQFSNLHLIAKNIEMFLKK